MTQDNDNQEEVQEVELAPVGITKINLKADPVAIGDVLDEIAPQGVKAKVADFVDQEIVIHSVRQFTGEFGQAAFVIFTDENGELFNTVIGQKVVLAKIMAVADRLPVSATLVKEAGGRFGEYYDIT